MRVDNVDNRLIERRLGSDRRKHPRGGRRPGDRPGYFPLVMVIEPEAGRRDITEAILTKQCFAVVPLPDDSNELIEKIREALRARVIPLVSP